MNRFQRLRSWRTPQRSLVGGERRRMNGTEPEIVGTIDEIEVVAIGRGIRHLSGLRKQRGEGRWRFVDPQE